MMKFMLVRENDNMLNEIKDVIQSNYNAPITFDSVSNYPTSGLKFYKVETDWTRHLSQEFQNSYAGYTNQELIRECNAYGENKIIPISEVISEQLWWYPYKIVKFLTGGFKKNKEPISVIEFEDGGYGLLDGNHRFICHHLLGIDTIKAKVLTFK